MFITSCIIAPALLMAMAIACRAQDIMPPTNGPAITVTPKTAKEELTWLASVSPAVTGYNLFYWVAGASTNEVSISAVTNTVISNLVSGTTYFVAIAAVNSWGVQSALSQVISFTAGKPAPVYLPAIECQVSTDMVNWSWRVLRVLSNGPAMEFYRGFRVRLVPGP